MFTSLQNETRGDNEGLSDVFYTNERKGHLIHVKLNRSGITLEKGNKEKNIKISDIVGGRCIMRVKKSSISNSCGCTSLSSCSVVNKTPSFTRERELSAYFHVYAYVLRPKNIRNIIRRERTVLVLRFCSFDTFEENMQEAEKWNQTLNFFKNTAVEITKGLSPSNCRRKILMFLNPKSGSGKARRLFHIYSVPVLNEADLLYDLHVTKHINYAKEFVRQRDLTQWSNIVAVGGDGLFFEILNGLLKRQDWKHVVQMLSLGIVPCGSGNGLAKTLSHIYNEPYEPRPILSATLSVIRGHTAAMDVVRLELRNQILYSFLSVGWGLISDIDIESERLRSLGYQRFTLWSLHRLISLRTYRGRISYLPKKKFDDVSSTKDSTENLTTNKYQNVHIPRSGNFYKSTECVHHAVPKLDDISLQTSITRSFRSGLESWCSADSCESMYYSIAESVYRSIPSEKTSNHDGISILSGVTESSCGPVAIDLTLNDPLPEKWITEDGEFVMVQATYQTHLSTDCYFSPSSRLNDGTIYLVIIRAGISRAQLLQFLMNMSSGTHISLKHDTYVKVIAVTAFRIEPQNNHGIMTVDGERIEFGPIQGAIIPGAIKVIVPN